MFNYRLYEKTIFKNLLLDKDDWYFKSDKSYTEILEHVSFESGLKYLLLIEDKFNVIYTNNKDFIIDICNLNDKYGKTIKQNFKNFCCCSPSNIRYIFHALLILEHMIKTNLNNIDIVEIGGGYGGLCLFLYKLSTLFNITINSYSIFDLNEPMKLQKKYLEIHNVPINTISLDDEIIIIIYMFIFRYYIILYMYLSQAEQDKFVLQVLKEKKNGYFLEIGSNHPVNINNSYILEKKYNWKGIMVEYDSSYLELYKLHRQNSIYVMNDATVVDYKNILETNNMPLLFDYLQIDLEANNGSTIRTLEKLDNEIFDLYKFATITFEHDIYNGDYDNTRLKSREIFKKRGYTCVFEDISNNGNPFEDWYVHPDLVDMNYINKLIENNKKNYIDHLITNKTINWKNINYTLPS